MREILSRGKRVDNGEWVEGFLVKHPSAVQIGDCSPWYISVPPMDPEDNGGLYNVDPETIGQFIGLTDKNGKKIFEGDLLDGFEYPFYRSEDNTHNYFGEIVWFDENCAFGLVTHKHPTSKVRGISAGNSDYIEEFDLGEWEIIGNIYDNPELMWVS